VEIIRVMGKDVLSKVGWLSRHLGVGVARSGRLSPYSGLAVTTLVALSVGMMIVPLPTFLLDLAISLNIAMAVTMLLLAIHVGDALRIATFPSLLLLTTLFRLSIEVSATRLILLKANAGEVIHAFGSFVVAGNLVVGVVVFFILTVVQFIVVAKGAERVSEVGARFTLDALPGKQMAIDSELRAGPIHLEEAHIRRMLLTRESQFFGAMDGAMKFVKGDAIAGIVILLTNIVGGLIVGILQHGLDVGIAVRTYTLLTIGEGLVAQIPALIISTAAGIIVTRVSSEKEDGHLGSDIARQVLAQPKALASSAVLLAVLAIVPGLPALPFLVLASVLGLVAFVLIGRARRAAADGSLRPATGSRALQVPIGIDLGTGIAQQAVLRLRQQLLPQLRERFFDETGITLPEILIREVSSLPRGDYAIRLHEVAVATAHMAADEREDAIVEELLQLLRRHGHEFVGVETTQSLLDNVAASHRHLLSETVPKLISTVKLAEILQFLAKDGVSLRYLPRILECLARRAPLEDGAAELADTVRASLRCEITGKFVAANGSLRVLLLDPTIEETVRESIQKRGADTVLAIEPDLGHDIVSAVGRMVADAGAPVIVTTADIRRHLRGLLEVDHPDVAVLAFQEILPEVKLETVGHVTVPI
jgi:type III secretion protein V